MVKIVSVVLIFTGDYIRSQTTPATLIVNIGGMCVSLRDPSR